MKDWQYYSIVGFQALTLSIVSNNSLSLLLVIIGGLLLAFSLIEKLTDKSTTP